MYTLDAIDLEGNLVPLSRLRLRCLRHRRIIAEAMDGKKVVQGFSLMRKGFARSCWPLWDSE